MQDTCYCFPTEVRREIGSEPPKSSPNIRELIDPQKTFTTYINNFDVKLSKGMQTQQFNVNIRKRHLLDQLDEVRSKQQQILEDVRRRYSYFEEHYFRFLRDDIGKFSEYNEFFKRYFTELHRKIEYTSLANTKRRMLVDSLKERLKQLMKENRRLENTGAPTERLVPKLKNTDSTEASIRMTTEPDKFQSILSSCRYLPPLTYHYMQPIVRTARNEKSTQADKWLELLLQLLEFRQQDSKNRYWLWIEELIYKPRHFAKLRTYLQNRIECIRLA